MKSWKRCLKENHIVAFWLIDWCIIQLLYVCCHAKLKIINNLILKDEIWDHYHDILAQLYLLKKKTKKKKHPDLDRHLSLHILILQLFLFIKVRSRKPVTEWSITLMLGKWLVAIAVFKYPDLSSPHTNGPKDPKGRPRKPSNTDSPRIWHRSVTLSYSA